MTIVAWVLGSSGLLGAALYRALRRNGTRLFSPIERFSWENGPELDAQFAAAVQAFSSQVTAADRWEIYWAAGVGTMGSRSEALAAETRALSSLLRLVASDPNFTAVSGALAFASSAGAIYAGASDEIITENSPPKPTTAYALEKLRQEDMVRSFSDANHGTAALIARISTLYGPGHSAGKKQGLLAHIARSLLRNQPIQIYVPYDTIRDYIAADDAAAEMVTALRATGGQPRVLIKLIASEHPVTIAEIISIFKKISRRHPRIVTSVNKLSGLYSRRLRFRSVVLPELTGVFTRGLPVGIAQLMISERSAFVRGSGTGSSPKKSSGPSLTV